MASISGKLSTSGKSWNRIYYSIGWTALDADAGVFREMYLPSNRVMRVMERSVHQAALASAREKLLELERKSGQKEPAL